MIYIFQKVVAGDRLAFEIANSTITVALNYINTTSNSSEVVFKAQLSTQEEATLSTLVQNHVALPMPENTIQSVSVREQPAFALPEYRTKRNCSATIETVNPGETKTIDMVLTQERFVAGGELIYENAQWGDYITAQIFDVNAVIPAPYRATICENWPDVATYIEKMWIEPAATKRTIDTYPLNARITPGLALRITYFATNAGQPRKIAANYFLTKKL